MQKVFERPKSLTDVEFAYCAGCTHSVIHRMIAEVMDELDIAHNTIGVCPVGCAVFMYEYMACMRRLSPSIASTSIHSELMML